MSSLVVIGELGLWIPAHTGNRQGSNLGCPVSSLELAKQVGAALRREQVRIVLAVLCCAASGARNPGPSLELPWGALERNV